ncbi:MAG: hypothetical protein ACI9WU_000925 [Myxococcota bacterium]|jgi:hypothetical protein
MESMDRTLSLSFSVAMWTYVLTLTLIATSAAIVLFLLGALLWDRQRRTFAGLIRIVGRALNLTLQYRLEFRGDTSLPPGPFVITPNHSSVVDLIVLCAVARRQGPSVSPRTVRAGGDDRTPDSTDRDRGNGRGVAAGVTALCPRSSNRGADPATGGSR